MEQAELKELKGLVKEVFQEEITASEKRAQEKNEAWQTEFSKLSKENQSAIEKRIEAIEKMPLIKQRISVPGTNGSSEVFLGYKIERQLRDVFTGDRCGYAKDVVANPKLFPIIADEEKRVNYAKFILAVLKAGISKDVKSISYLEEIRAKAALQEGTTTEGGFLVPDEFSDEILAFARLQSFALQDCRIWPMSTDVRRVPAENAKVSVTWTAEESDATESEPTFNEVVLTAKRLDAFSIASNELLQDSAVDIVSYLTEIFAEAVGQELDNKVLNGTGDPWSGVLTAAAGFSVVMASTLTNFSSITADNLLDMIGKIPQEAEDGAKFYFHKTILTFIQKLKAATTGEYLFSPIGVAGIPANIWAYPYVRTPKGPSTTGANTAFVAFGNMRHFALGRRLQSMTLDVDPYGLFKSNRTQFRIVNRFAGSIGLANAFCRLITAAS